MAREIQKREDLLNDATAYARRLMILLGPTTNFAEEEREFFAGCRMSGGWSLYFGEAPVIQFNAEGDIRRLYWEGRKFVAEKQSLTELRRDADHPNKALHLRIALDAETVSLIRLELRTKLDLLESALRELKYTEIGRHPKSDDKIVDDLRNFLSAINGELRFANQPNA